MDSSERNANHMSDLHFYRADEELTLALRQLRQDSAEFVERVIKPFVAEFPDNEPVQSNWNHQIIGFRDGKLDAPPPEGLSRNKKRDYLIPKSGKIGESWHARLLALNERPTLSDVLKTFGIPREEWRSDLGKVFLVNYADFEEEGVVIYLGCELSEVPPCLTPIKRSEGYAMQERYKETHDEQSTEPA